MLPQSLFLVLALSLFSFPLDAAGNSARHAHPVVKRVALPEQLPRTSPSFAKRALNETHKGITSLSLAHDGQSYFSVIQVGGINFRVALDTASSDLWLTSSSCASTACRAVPPYPLSYHSPTFVAVNNNQTSFNASYADGTFARGFVARERVTLANLTIPDQVLGVITESNVSLTDRNSGLLGLGFPRLSSVNQTVTNSTPFFANLAQQGLLEYPLFGVKLTKNSTGSLSFGAVDASAVLNPRNISWNPVVQFAPFTSENNVSSYLHWAIPIDGFSVNNTQLTTMPTYANITNNMSIALIDIGTSGLYGPIQDVTRFFSLINGARLVDPSGQWVIPCDTSIPVSFTFGQVSYSMQPSDYIIGPAAGNPNLCLSWPMALPPNSDGIDWQVGTNFLRTVYSVFSYGINRREPPMIGFYPFRNQTANHTQSPTDTVSSIVSALSGVSTVPTTLPNFPLPTPSFTTPPFAFNTSISTSNGGIVSTALATSTYSPILAGPNANVSAVPTIAPQALLQTFILTNAQGLLTTSVSTAVEPSVTLGLPPGWNAGHRTIDGTSGKVIAGLGCFMWTILWLI